MKIKELSNNMIFTYRRRKYRVANDAETPASERPNGVRCQAVKSGKYKVIPYEEEVTV